MPRGRTCCTAARPAHLGLQKAPECASGRSPPMQKKREAGLGNRFLCLGKTGSLRKCAPPATSVAPAHRNTRLVGLVVEHLELAVRLIHEIAKLLFAARSLRVRLVDRLLDRVAA
jgi:hypothetical protein